MPLLNKDVFLKDPLETSIPNLGVAKVGEPQDDAQWGVLRYELSSFVCEGEYERGLERIFSTFLKNLDRESQPAVWVSGFYGSGKSHFARVLEALWRDVEFSDGQRARDIVHLSSDIEDQLRQLTTAGRRVGGLWAASGMLGAGAGNSVRLALLSILFVGAGLPPQYARARFVLWLRQNNYEAGVRAHLETQGRSFDHELQHMTVSPHLANALLAVVPGLANTSQDVLQLLRTQYPAPADISDHELVESMEAVLALKSTAPGKRPLTLVIFDELQQYIGEDPSRTLQVQQVVEACSSQFGSSVLFLATGQAALQGPPQLQKLQGRFTVRVMLSDADVENVVREVVLRKREDRKPELEAVLERASGEINRHLVNSNIAANAGDAVYLVSDYPLLPSRRRFWERVLRAVDSAGTAGQLRTQLRIVLDATRDVATKPLGWVVGGDVIFDQLKTDMLQSGVLLTEINRMIGELGDGSADGRLRARLCGTIFLIGRLPATGPLAAGLRATTATLADLLVEDLTAGSADLRQRIPALLHGLVESGRLMLVEDEYRLQTREGMLWEQDFRERYTRISNDDQRVAGDRATAIKNAVNAGLKGVAFLQGESKTPRKPDLHVASDAPRRESGNVPVWVRDEWLIAEQTVRTDAQEAGVESPVVFVSLPRRDADALKSTLVRVAAAEETLNAHGLPNTEEGRQARAAMDSRRSVELYRLAELVDALLAGAKVFQGGGNEIHEGSLKASVQRAFEAGVERLYPEFKDGDNANWAKVGTKAIEGAGDPLASIGFTGDVGDQPACRKVRVYVGGSPKKGSDVRKRFGGPPYGWPQDTVDGALLALTQAGILKATRNGVVQPVKTLTKQQLGTTDFVGEGVTPTKLQWIAVRRFLQTVGVKAATDDDARTAFPGALNAMLELAYQAGGEPPLPSVPNVDYLRDLLALSGNELIVAAAQQSARLEADFAAWKDARDEIVKRQPRWQSLRQLLRHAGDLPIVATVQPQVDAIVNGRALLETPDPVTPLRDQVSSALRAAVQNARQAFVDERERQSLALESSDAWNGIKADERKALAHVHGLGPAPDINVSGEDDLIRSLGSMPLSSWREKLAAAPGRFAGAREAAARLLAPQAVTVTPKKATLHTPAEVDAYLADLRAEMMQHINADKPVIV